MNVLAATCIALSRVMPIIPTVQRRRSGTGHMGLRFRAPFDVAWSVPSLHAVRANCAKSGNCPGIHKRCRASRPPRWRAPSQHRELDLQRESPRSSGMLVLAWRPGTTRAAVASADELGHSHDVFLSLLCQLIPWA